MRWRRRRVVHDFAARRADRELWVEPPRLAFMATPAGQLELAVIPAPPGDVYVVRLPRSAARVVRGMLDDVGRELAPLVAEDYEDAGPFERWL